MNRCETHYFECFLQPSERYKATRELAQLGTEALPILESLFSGEALNQFNTPYNRLGTPLECSLVVVKMLGEVAAPFESVVRGYASKGHLYAISALGHLGNIREESVSVLIDLVLKYPGSEAASALIKSGNQNHPQVKIRISESCEFKAAIERVITFL